MDSASSAGVVAGRPAAISRRARSGKVRLPMNTADVAESVGHPDQRLRRMTVAELADLMATEDSGAPALILYGALADGRP